MTRAHVGVCVFVMCVCVCVCSHCVQMGWLHTHEHTLTHTMCRASRRHTHESWRRECIRTLVTQSTHVRTHAHRTHTTLFHVHTRTLHSSVHSAASGVTTRRMECEYVCVVNWIRTTGLCGAWLLLLSLGLFGGGFLVLCICMCVCV